MGTLAPELGSQVPGLNAATARTGTHAPVTVSEVARSVPRGSRRIGNQREALRAGLSCPDLAGVRADFRAHLEAWWRIHVGYASWGGQGRAPRGTTEPTRKKVCALAGRVDPATGELQPMGVSTYKRCSAWWRERGYAAVVRTGWTTALCPMGLLEPGACNRRQVLVLCLPHQKKPVRTPPAPHCPLTGPLTRSRREPGIAPRARPGENQGKPGKDRAPRGQSVLPRGGPAPPAAVPQSGSEALAAARTLQERAGLLRGVSDRCLRHLARPFWRAGWTSPWILYALDHEPGGRPHGYTAAVRSPAGWIRARLAAWTGPDGQPLPSPGQIHAAAAAADRAAQAARRREAEQLAAGKSPDYAGHAARARAMLRDAAGPPRPRPGGSGDVPELSWQLLPVKGPISCNLQQPLTGANDT